MAEEDGLRTASAPSGDLRALREQLARQEKARAYKTAAQTLEKIQIAEERLEARRKRAASAGSGRVLVGLRERERDTLKSVERKQARAREEHLKAARAQLADLSHSHQRKLMHLRGDLRATFAQRPPRVTPEIIELQQQERNLCRAMDYTEARKVQKRVEELLSQEKVVRDEHDAKELAAVLQAEQVHYERVKQVMVEKQTLALAKLESSFLSEREQLRWIRHLFIEDAQQQQRRRRQSEQSELADRQQQQTTAVPER